MGDSSKAKQIKVLLSVLVTGLVAGLLIALSMLYYYNPTGSYLAKNMLLDPERAYTLKFVEPGPKGKSKIHYAFNGVTFSFFDITLKQQMSIAVSREKYAEWYHRIAHETSIVNPTHDVESLFNQPRAAILTLNVHAIGEDSSKGMTMTFSGVDFVNGGDYYRIQLRQSGPSSSWVYFYHPGIYQESLNLFNET